jgi:hypothetical protein
MTELAIECLTLPEGVDPMDVMRAFNEEMKLFQAWCWFAETFEDWGYR